MIRASKKGFRITRGGRELPANLRSAVNFDRFLIATGVQVFTLLDFDSDACADFHMGPVPNR